jgi:hypothetical protein
VPVLRSVAAAAVVSLTSFSGLSLAGVSTAATRATAAPSGIGALIAEKLEANGKYPYTQVTLALPRIAVKGVSAEQAALVTGLRIVVDAARAAKPAAATAKLDVLYKTTDLGQLRFVGGNLYLRANIAKWSVLPVHWSKSTVQELSSVDVAFGERWLEVTASTLASLEKKSADPAVLKRLSGSTSAMNTALSGALAKFVKGVTFTQTAAPNGNLAFRASGPLQTLADNGAAAISAIEQSLPAGTVKSTLPAPGKVKGSYTLVLSTAAAGAYISNITLAIGVPGTGSLTFVVAYGHAVEPVGAPTGATVITPQDLSGMGL